MSPRDLSDYTEKYTAAPFEPIQAEYRRKLVIKQITKRAPRHLVEVGCGLHPLFTSVPIETWCTVVEPTQAFASNARALAVNYPNATILETFVENCQKLPDPCDMIVASGLLHEVDDPKRLLEALKLFCGPETVVHVNVPNAFSLHRLLAVAMGLISEPDVPSDSQVKLQQRGTTYSMASLERQMLGARFAVFEKGTSFVKPFTHAQMQFLVEAGFMDQRMLDGLDKLTTWLPDLGSELWVNARLLVD
jgi:hypothetical protein